jgi:uncharacterized protein
MKMIFADTYYYLAILNPRDQGNASASEASERHGRHFVTTHWILAEVGDALARVEDRPKFLALLDALVADRGVEIVAADDQLYWEGVQLFRNRPDKNWSFTDCTSFVVMEKMGIRDALTADIHFEQAGFVALLKE